MKKTIGRSIRALVVTLLFVAAWAGPAAPESKGPAPAPAPAAEAKSALPVTLEQTLYLIRSTLLTLNDANRSGNYTVLRDLAAPEFQARNTAADLSLIFSDLRQRKFDLFAVALVAPQLSTPPYVDPNKMLKIVGYVPTRPLQINFDLTFQVVDGHWRLHGISVATTPAPPLPPPAPPVEEPPAKAKSKK
ncbi:MAG TPA: hypothetical protein VFB68_00065 [Xanthobacteraceae bacterium]|nr:hypothetical protein [Xanthobacteraceae bacterium]